MPTIDDSPPREVEAEIVRLREVLDRDIPSKALDRNLLIATWNIRGFGDLTMKWEAGEDDSPTRDLHALHCITEIVSRFDVVAIQEAKGNLRALRKMIKLLGPEWGLILTDVTRGDAGNGERLAFLFDQRKVQLSGLAAELVVPKEQIEENKIQPDALQEQFARTPYAVSFRCNDKTFILVTLHVLYGKKAAQRTPELAAIARWMADWAADVNAWDHNLIALGDFNIDRKDDPRYQAFMSTGLQAPEDLNRVPRSIFADPDTPQLEKFYDQIAWFTGEGGVPELSLDYVKGGNFDFVPHVLTSRGLTKNQLSYRMSDHYPLWVEFAVRR